MHSACGDVKTEKRRNPVSYQEIFSFFEVFFCITNGMCEIPAMPGKECVFVKVAKILVIMTISVKMAKKRYIILKK